MHKAGMILVGLNSWTCKNATAQVDCILYTWYSVCEHYGRALIC